jgi:cephalosporin-C deacetylase-like acetyl esterase
MNRLKQAMLLGVTMASIAATTKSLGAATGAASLRPAPGGGWESVGLPYAVRFSAGGYLESLRVGALEWLTPSTGEVRGLYHVAGEERRPFASAGLAGDGLRVANDRVALTIRCRPEGIAVLCDNRSAEYQALRLELSPGWNRIKNPVSGEDYERAKGGSFGGQVRLIAAGGSALELPAEFIAVDSTRWTLRFPSVYRFDEAEWLLRVYPESLLEDAVAATVRAGADDFTFWTAAPQTVTAEVVNVSGAPFRGEVGLQLRDYLTRGIRYEAFNALKLQTGGTGSAAWTLKGLEPGLYLADILLKRGGATGVVARRRLVFDAGKIAAPEPPADFDAFWRETLAEQARIPEDLQLAPPRAQGNSEIYKFSFAGLLGYRCHGWLTVPKDKTQKYPAVLVLPSSGLKPFQPAVFPHDDRVGMVISINTVDVDLPPEAYDTSTWPAPYLAHGIQDKRRYVLRYSYAALVRAAEILARRPEVRADDILVTGSSQGGGLTLVAAGLYPHFKAAVANVPALCRLDWNLEYLQPPYFPIAVTAQGKPRIARTLAYYDAVQFARRITCPIWISLGLYDDVTPSMGVFSAWNVLPAKRKTIEVSAGGGHNSGAFGNYEEVVRGVWP